jgi:hypothetical protein
MRVLVAPFQVAPGVISRYCRVLARRVKHKFFAVEFISSKYVIGFSSEIGSRLSSDRPKRISPEISIIRNLFSRSSARDQIIRRSSERRISASPRRFGGASPAPSAAVLLCFRPNHESRLSRFRRIDRGRFPKGFSTRASERKSPRISLFVGSTRYHRISSLL